MKRYIRASETGTYDAKLANNEDWHVRRRVAERTNDPGILMQLANDEHPNVREVVAQRIDKAIHSGANAYTLKSI